MQSKVYFLRIVYNDHKIVVYKELGSFTYFTEIYEMHAAPHYEDRLMQYWTNDPIGDVATAMALVARKYDFKDLEDVVYEDR